MYPFYLQQREIGGMVAATEPVAMSTGVPLVIYAGQKRPRVISTLRRDISALRCGGMRR